MTITRTLAQVYDLVNFRMKHERGKAETCIAGVFVAGALCLDWTALKRLFHSTMDRTTTANHTQLKPAQARLRIQILRKVLRFRWGKYMRGSIAAWVCAYYLGETLFIRCRP